MGKKSKWFLAILLSVCMVVSLTPAAVFGNDSGGTNTSGSLKVLADENDLRDLTVKDPSIFADKRTQTYFMYAANPDPASPGVIAWQSKDLATWSDPILVYTVPTDSWNGQETVMTPEVSLYDGKYYLFVTLQNSSGGVVPRALNDRLHTTFHRSVVVAVADTPAGPFTDIDKTAPVTGDLKYMHRDGTLYVAPNGTPYLIYAHDWTQKIDGNFQAVALKKDDLSKKAADQFLLFRASLASFYTDAEYEGSASYKQANSDAFAPYKAFNPQIYNTPEGGLVMLWGTEREGKLVVNQAVSKTGSLNGPWVQKPILLRDGRSAAMSITAFDGKVMLLCQNASGKVELYDATVTNDGFKLGAHRGDLDGLSVSAADTLAPRLFPPSTRLVETADASAAVPFAATAYDNVDGWIDVTYSTAPGSTFTKGTHTVTATATDAAGNTSSATFKVIVSNPIPKETPASYTSAISTTGGYPLKLPQMTIHDPYIYYDSTTEHYILHQGTGTNVWKSKDLINWAGPIRAFTVVGRGNDGNLGTNYQDWLNATFTPEAPWNRTNGNWAAEMFPYKGKYYFFTTLHNSWAKPKLSSATDESSYVLPDVAWRASIIAQGTSPEGPFTNMQYTAPVTPRDFMTLDATLYVDHDGKPWLVYAHEWVQKMDGTMEAIPLTEDLTAAAGDPLLMFRSSATPWYEYQRYQNQPQYASTGGARYTTVDTTKELSAKQCTQYVTDGPHIWETPDGSLVCLFTTYRDDEYIQTQFVSRTGNIAGPWEPAPYLDFDDKGHAMIFEDKDDNMKLVMHNNMGGASDKTIVMNAAGVITGNQQSARAEISDVTLTNDGFRIVDHREDLDGQVNVTSYNDTLAPLIYAPADRYVSVSNGTSAAAVAFNAYAMDDKDGWNYKNPNDVTLTYSHLPGSVFPVGTTEVTLTAKDSKQNVSTKTFSVNVIDKTALNLKITAALAIDPATSDATAYAVLRDKLFDAREAFDARYVSQATVDAATNALSTAIHSILDPSPSLLAALQIVIDSFAQFQKADYTAVTWTPFEAALDAAQAILDHPGEYIEADVYETIDALMDAADKLVRVADKSALKGAIDFATDMLKPANVGKYIPVSVTNLEDALSSAAIVYANTDATQVNVDKVYGDLLRAVNQMYEKGDKAGLQALVTLVSRYAQASYTPASWTAFTKALDDARAVIANPNAVADSVNKAYAALTAAITGLTRKADIAALNASIALAQKIVDNIGDYVPSTVVGLAEELGSAKAVAENPNATQAQVNAAAAALGAKILAARLKPDLSGLLSATTRAKAQEERLYTAASYKALTTAMTGAEAVLRAPEKVTQADVDGVTQAVNRAIAALVPKADIAGNDGKTTATGGKTVIPKGKISKITASAKGKIVVKWAKAPAAAKVTGYQVQYRVKGASKWTTKTVSAKSASLTIKNLKKNKKYQIRVRAYRSVSGTKQYGAWSAVKVSKK